MSLPVIVDENHYTVESARKLYNICKPLFEKSEISYFYHTRYYFTGYFYSLNSDAEWYKYFYNNRFYAKEEYFINMPPVYYEFLENYDLKASDDASYFFGLDNFFVICYKKKTWCDMFGFASKTNIGGMKNFYINNLKLLNQFCLYFKHMANNIILETNRKNNLILLPDFIGTKKIEFIEKSKIDYLWPFDLLPNQIYVESGNHETFITKKELLCLYYLTQGRTAKSIAKILDISNRTVELHFNKIKTKLNLNTKDQLIDFFSNNMNLSHLFFK